MLRRFAATKKARISAPFLLETLGVFQLSTLTSKFRGAPPVGGASPATQG